MVFENFSLAVRTVRQNGGLWRSAVALFVRDDLRYGKFVGEDDYGNKYYENNNFFLGRNRWVNYADHVYLDYDASQVPPEWSGWLHYRTDRLPHEDPTRPKYPWMSRHEENMTGTPEQYVPYSTTLPKIEAWRPHKSVASGSGTKFRPRLQYEGGSCCPGVKRREDEKLHPCDAKDSKKGDKHQSEKKEQGPCEKPSKAFH